MNVAVGGALCRWHQGTGDGSAFLMRVLVHLFQNSNKRRETPEQSGSFGCVCHSGEHSGNFTKEIAVDIAHHLDVRRAHDGADRVIVPRRVRKGARARERQP